MVCVNAPDSKGYMSALLFDELLNELKHESLEMFILLFYIYTFKNDLGMTGADRLICCLHFSPPVSKYLVLCSSTGASAVVCRHTLPTIRMYNNFYGVSTILSSRSALIS